MAEAEGLHCCGITELANIRHDDTPEQSLMELEYNEQAFVVFSDTNNNNYRPFRNGNRLANLIKKAKLGAVVSMPYATNPNTGNRVKTWLWRVDKRAFRSWQAKHRKANPGQYVVNDPYYNPYFGGDAW